MADVADISVAVNAAGSEEVKQDLESVEEKVGEVGGEMEQTAGDMQDLNSQMTGLGKTLVAALGIAAAGLLSQIPILGEIMSGFGAIAGALAYQIDQLLRPALSGVAPTLFDISAAIYEADGAVGDFIGAVSALALGATLLAGALSGANIILGPLLGKTLSLPGAFAAAKGAISGAVAAFSSFVAGSLAAQVAIGGLLGLFGVGILEVTGFMDKVRALGDMVGNALPGWARDGLLALISIFAGPISVIGAMISGFVDGFLEGRLDEGIDRAVENGSRMLEIFKGAWVRTADRIIEKVKGLIDWIMGIPDAVTDAVDSISDLPGGAVDTVVGGTTDFVGDVSGGIGDTFGGGGSNTSGGGFSADRGRGPINLSLDGRSLTRTDSRFRRNGTASRFRNG